MTARKRFYVPGMISLIGLVFLLPYSYNKSLPAKVNYLSFVVPKTGNGKTGYLFTTDWVLDDIKNKKKLNFLLTGDHFTNKKKLETIRYEARRLKYTLDKSTVIFITFTEEMTYDDFVQLLDICKTDSLKRYATWDKYFVILEELPPPQRIKNEYQIPLMSCDVIHLLKVPPKRSLLTKLVGIAKPFTLLQIGSLSVLWVAMIFLTAFNRKQKKTHHAGT